MKLHIKYFASIREALGQGNEAVDSAAGTVGALRDELIARGGAYAQVLARGKAVRVAVNQTMGDESAPLQDGAEHPEPPRVVPAYVPRAPQTEQRGQIVAVHGSAVQNAGQNQVVIINKGEIVADNKASELQKHTTVQTVYVEFEDQISKSQLQKVPHVRKVEQVKGGWLLETVEEVDLRRVISKHASDNNWLTLTLKIEEKSLEEVFKELTTNKK